MILNEIFLNFYLIFAIICYYCSEESLFIIKKYKPVIIFEQHILSDNVTDSINLLNIFGYHTFIINEQSGEKNDCRNLLAIPDEKYDLFCKQFIFFEYLIDINNLENEKNLCLNKNS